MAYSSNKIYCSKHAFQAAEYHINKYNINATCTSVPGQDMRLLPSAPLKVYILLAGVPVKRVCVSQRVCFDMFSNTSTLAG